ncbi:unnamed protein product, partial [Choristocarpus tenellus]
AIRSLIASHLRGLSPGSLSALARVSITSDEILRDSMSFFEVTTSAWDSTRVRVAIDGCNPFTAVLASFGALPTPSHHDVLAPAMLDSNGTSCGVDIWTTVSGREGTWFLAVVGGSPLHGLRYFAGPPDKLTFEVTTISEV